MKTLGTTFGSLGGPIVGKVTLGSFSAPPVPGDLKNDLRLTWDTMGPHTRAKVPPGPESKRNRECHVLLENRSWRSAGQFWHHEVTAASYKPCASQPPALKAKETKSRRRGFPKGEPGFRASHFHWFLKQKIDIARDRRPGSHIHS